ncbi:MAG: hypothetical protein COW30_00905 [Rhodospirillales bacterium CG15_BIG_FIL_POST_REV_8_21_14_020_66_15]|nr:MAG: hypothetical protein COW30_00905 [Rhodospirillales bacterium CG15_BIG_FIL_POST_REV_8_21_14_020_66_15]
MTDLARVVTPEVLLLAAFCFAVVAGGSGPLIRLLVKFDLMAHPNERSNHTVATPEGSGILVIAALIPAWFLIADRPMAHVLVPALVLGVLSWLDDTRGLSPAIRFPAHILAVAAALWFEPTFIYPLQQFVPEPLAYFIIAFVWVWFINLFNFMDGIDGITGAETASIGIGVAAVVAVHGLAADFGALGICTAATALGFLIWNWPPAKVFLGDVGSVPLGFLLGWLLLSLAAAGPWIVAIILPAYYLADSTLTLLYRMVRRKKIWRAHREHFYQRAAVGWRNHGRVVICMLACNLVLIAISVTYDRFGFFGSWVLAAVPVAVLLAVFLGAGRSASTPPGA